MRIKMWERGWSDVVKTDKTSSLGALSLHTFTPY